jgi:hypothetical protein
MFLPWGDSSLDLVAESCGSRIGNIRDGANDHIGDKIILTSAEAACRLK